MANGEEEILNKLDYEESFEKTYKCYTDIFLDEKNLNKKEEDVVVQFDENKGVLLLEHENSKFYDGSLWENEDVDYIGKLDYFYTVPSWDWWINPLFDRENNRGDDKTVLFIDKYTDNKDYIEEILESEGFKIRKKYNLNDSISKNLWMFYEYVDRLLPMNFARELKRIDRFIENDDSNRLNFVLRGGYFLKEFLDSNDRKSMFIDPRKDNTNKDSGEIYIDDCIGTAETFNSLIDGDNPDKYCCLDSTLPKEEYERYFPRVEFSLPSDLLNIYSCRLFEENPRMIGVDYLNDGIIRYENPVRDKLISKIKNYRNYPDLENKIYKLAKRLIEYGKD